MNKQAVKASRKTGHKIASVLLLGPFGNSMYNNFRASGNPRASALGKTILLKYSTLGVGTTLMSYAISNKIVKNYLGSSISSIMKSYLGY